jgi:O-Antigen ligase
VHPSEINQLAGPPLPNWFLLPATAIFAVATIYFIMRTRGRAARFLIFACWLRFTLGSLQAFTYDEAFAGIKWVGLGSLLIVGTSLIFLDKRRFISRPFYPVGILCVLMLFSALLNGSMMMAVEPILRFFIFVIIAVALWQALESGGSGVLKRLLFVFIQPLTYQLASIVLNVPKSGELDGSVSYIGGYYHEELFSLLVAISFFVAVFAGKLGKFTRLGICLAALISIDLADYRTTMLGVVPLALTAIFIGMPRAFLPSQRTSARLAIIVAGVVMVGAVAVAESDRFADLAVLAEPTTLIRPPETFTWADRRVLSSRPYIWSEYIYAYADAPRLQKWIGYGPDSWQTRMPIYAHNTLVSFLYELGVLGVFAILLVWGNMIRLAFMAEKRWRALLISGHANFMVLNFATMAHWQVEGNILYGLLCGFTIAKARQAIATNALAQRSAIRAHAADWPGMPPIPAAQLPSHPSTAR